MERRTCARIPVKIDARFNCCNRDESGTVLNVSEKGMYISVDEICFPFDSRFVVSLVLNETVLTIPVNLSRIEMSPDSDDGIGVEILHPPDVYIDFIKGLQSAA